MRRCLILLLVSQYAQGFAPVLSASRMPLLLLQEQQISGQDSWLPTSASLGVAALLLLGTTPLDASLAAPTTTNLMTPAQPPLSCFTTLPLADSIKVLDTALPSYDDVKGYKASVETVGSLSKQGYVLPGKTKSGGLGDFASSSGLGDVNIALPNPLGIKVLTGEQRVRLSPNEKRAQEAAQMAAAQAAADKKAGRVRLAVTLSPGNMPLGISIADKPSSGTVVTDVTQGSALADQGLKVGDELVTLSGQDISQRPLADLKLLLSKSRKQGGAELTVVRSLNMAETKTVVADAASDSTTTTPQLEAPTPSKLSATSKGFVMPQYDLD